MKYRELARTLREAQFVSRQGKGDHQVWSHCAIQVSNTQTHEVSPGLTAKALKAIERSEHA